MSGLVKDTLCFIAFLMLIAAAYAVVGHMEQTK